MLAYSVQKLSGEKKNLAKGLDSLVVVLNIFVSVASLLVAFV